MINHEFDIEVADLKSNFLKKEHAEKPVVFYGSSSIRLWSTLQTDFEGLPCLNLAFGGSNITDCIHYFPSLFENVSAQQLIFYCGDNDIGQEATAEEVMNRFKAFFILFREKYPLVPFTFISIKPSVQREASLKTIQKSNLFIEDYLKNQEKAFFLDIHHEMLLNEKVKKDLFLEDELHMNEKGYSIWKKIILPHVQKLY